MAMLEDDKLDLPIAALELPIRTHNMLEEEGVFTVGDLLNRSAEDLLRLPNFGQKSLAEVYAALSQLGFHRKGMRP